MMIPIPVCWGFFFQICVNVSTISIDKRSWILHLIHASLGVPCCDSSCAGSALPGWVPYSEPEVSLLPLPQKVISYMVSRITHVQSWCWFTPPDPQFSRWLVSLQEIGMFHWTISTAPTWNTLDLSRNMTIHQYARLLIYNYIILCIYEYTVSSITTDVTSNFDHMISGSPSRPSSQPPHLRFYKRHTELNVLQNMLHSKSNTFNYHSSCAIRITSSICHIHIANSFHHSKIRTKKSNESIPFRPFHPGPTGAAGPSMAWQPCPARKTVLQLLTVSPQWG